MTDCNRWACHCLSTDEPNCGDHRMSARKNKIQRSHIKGAVTWKSWELNLQMKFSRPPSCCQSSFGLRQRRESSVLRNYCRVCLCRQLFPSARRRIVSRDWSVGGVLPFWIVNICLHFCTNCFAISLCAIPGGQKTTWKIRFQRPNYLSEAQSDEVKKRKWDGDEEGWTWGAIDREVLGLVLLRSNI